MSIEGIGMPLTDRNSQLILAHSSPSYSSDGMVVDSDDFPGSIDPMKISFQNPKWNEFVDKMASDIIWNVLVAGKWKTKPKVELVRASVHHSGSQIPSLQALVQRSRIRSRTHTSGYRLALSYNIMHTSPNVPIPALPTMEPAVERLRRVLQQWRDHKYTRSASMPFRVYLLSRCYAKAEVNKFHSPGYLKVKHLLPLAGELGFTVSFATLTYVVEGYNHDVRLPDFFDREGKARRMNQSGSTVEEIVEEEGECLVSSDASDDSGSGAEDDKPEKQEKQKRKGRLYFGNVDVNEDVVIPKNPFQGKEPDEKKYDLEISHIYKRTAIVLYRQEDDLKLKLALKGDKWALEELHRRTKKNGKPDAYARRIASALLEKLSVSTRSLYPSYTGSSDDQTLQKVIRYSWTWEDKELWKRAFALCTNYCVKSIKGIVNETLEYFYVKDVLPLIKKLLHNAPSLSLRHRLEIADTVARYEDDRAVLDDLLAKAIESYGAQDKDDVETIVKVVREKSLRLVNDVIIPKVAKRHGVANFFSTLLLNLHEHRADFPLPSSPLLGEKALTPPIHIDVVIRRCLQEYITQWNRLSAADLDIVQHITEVGMYVGEVKIVSDFLATIPPLINHPT
ncbi:hypothetical protein FA13DRAFT_1791719 [Coprinellus micaceus]|uniref:Uncharacterized protein n=1 Tax=Coprinellus micaceus TaxID=71717 RepID=A0A4Y7TA29_COPMI|nr:hypothetical protein FA13DRAFT_1791719 [Coprinellus micaceus]